MKRKPLFETTLSKPENIIDNKKTIKFNTILQ